MSSPLRTIEDYELFLYSLTDQFPAVRRSTLVLVRRGATLARVIGELSFDHGFRQVVRSCPSLVDRLGPDRWHRGLRPL